MNCERCGVPLGEEEINYYRGKNLCEDCYIGALQPPKSCDVTAVHIAKKHRELTGQTGTEGLTELQKEIFNFVKIKGKATRQELIDFFKLPDWEIEKQIAILRHCELVKGKKEAGNVFLVPF